MSQRSCNNFKSNSSNILKVSRWINLANRYLDHYDELISVIIKNAYSYI